MENNTFSHKVRDFQKFVHDKPVKIVDDMFQGYNEWTDRVQEESLDGQCDVPHELDGLFYEAQYDGIRRLEPFTLEFNRRIKLVQVIEKGARVEQRWQPTLRMLARKNLFPLGYVPETPIEEDEFIDVLVFDEFRTWTYKDRVVNYIAFPRFGGQLLDQADRSKYFFQMRDKSVSTVDDPKYKIQGVRELINGERVSNIVFHYSGQKTKSFLIGDYSIRDSDFLQVIHGVLSLGTLYNLTACEVSSRKYHVNPHPWLAPTCKAVDFMREGRLGIQVLIDNVAYDCPKRLCCDVEAKSGFFYFPSGRRMGIPTKLEGTYTVDFSNCEVLGKSTEGKLSSCSEVEKLYGKISERTMYSCLLDIPIIQTQDHVNMEMAEDDSFFCKKLTQGMEGDISYPSEKMTEKLIAKGDAKTEQEYVCAIYQKEGAVSAETVDYRVRLKSRLFVDGKRYIVDDDKFVAWQFTRFKLGWMKMSNLLTQTTSGVLVISMETARRLKICRKMISSLSKLGATDYLLVFIDKNVPDIQDITYYRRMSNL